LYHDISIILELAPIDQTIYSELDRQQPYAEAHHHSGFALKLYYNFEPLILVLF